MMHVTCTYGGGYARSKPMPLWRFDGCANDLKRCEGGERARWEEVAAAADMIDKYIRMPVGLAAVVDCIHRRIGVLCVDE